MPQIANRDHCRINHSVLLKELKVIEKDYLPLVSSELKDQYQELLQTQKALKGDPVFNAGARLARFLHTRYLKLIEDLEVGKSNNRLTMDLPIDKIFARSPIIIPSKTPGKVYVFSNLILDTINLSDLRNICWIICFDSLKTFNENRQNKPNSWQPFSRAWQKIKRYEEMSLIRALTRYTNIRDYLTHDQLNSLTDSYIELTKPLKLIYAENPEDYISMFDKGGVNTCMTITNDKAECWREILKHKHHPMSLFAYHPDIKGIYCVKNKQVVARTCLYQTSPKVWKYGRLFTINSFYNKKFANMLTSCGYTQLGNRFDKKIEIKVPGIYSARFKEYLLPVPYMDNVSGNLSGVFDSKKKQFILTFGCAEKNANIATTSTGGFIKVSTLNSVKCCVCNNICKSPHVSWNGQRTFCTKRCARSSGYVYAISSNEGPQLRESNTCYCDFFDSDNIFTNKHSCIQNGGLIVIHNIIMKDKKIASIVIEPKEVSTSRFIVVYQDRNYCVGRTMYEHLLNTKLLCDGKLVCITEGVD